MPRLRSALALGGFVAGGWIVARELRRRRAFDLTNRVVLITGGSRGLGLLMARDAGRLGAHLVIAARDEAELLRAQRDLHAQDITASMIVADVATEAQAQRLVSQVIERHGRLDVLINNAGVIMVGPIDHMNVADFEEAMATHFWGPLHTMLAAIPHMRRGGSGGRIINFADWVAASGRPRYKGFVPYYVAKRGVIALTEVLALELASDQILVNAIAPGPILAPPGTTAEEAASVEAATPLGRWGGEVEIVKAVRFLIESDFVTGETIRVDGGRHVR